MALPTLSVEVPSLFLHFLTQSQQLSRGLVTSLNSTELSFMFGMCPSVPCVLCHSLGSLEPGSHDYVKPEPGQVMMVSEKQEEESSGLGVLPTRLGNRLLRLRPLLNQRC